MVKIQNTLQINKKDIQEEHEQETWTQKKKFQLLINLWQESLISSQRKMY